MLSEVEIKYNVRIEPFLQTLVRHEKQTYTYEDIHDHTAYTHVNVAKMYNSSPFPLFFRYPKSPSFCISLLKYSVLQKENLRQITEQSLQPTKQIVMIVQVETLLKYYLYIRNVSTFIDLTRKMLDFAAKPNFFFKQKRCLYQEKYDSYSACFKQCYSRFRGDTTDTIAELKSFFLPAQESQPCQTCKRTTERLAHLLPKRPVRTFARMRSVRFCFFHVWLLGMKLKVSFQRGDQQTLRPKIRDHGFILSQLVCNVIAKVIHIEGAWPSMQQVTVP